MSTARPDAAGAATPRRGVLPCHPAVTPDPRRMPRTRTGAHASQDLREACVIAARDVIAERGVEHLSLRDVARKLGVSHQAPYKHYPSRDHLLAEVTRRCFVHFAEYLDARKRFEDPQLDLASLGEQYLRYARQHPLEYRLMFGTPWPEAAVTPELVREATQAFGRLRDVMRRIHGDRPALVDLDAVYVWSLVHGMAGLLSGPSVEHLGMTGATLEQAVRHALVRVRSSLAAAPPSPPGDGPADAAP